MITVARNVLSLAILVIVTGTASAVAATLPRGDLAQLQAPNANVQQVSISIATGNPEVSTADLQAALGVLGGTTQGAANEVLAFANAAKGLVTPGAGHNPALAAALAIAVENIIGDAQNAPLVNGPYASTIAQAKATADAVLQDTEVQQAILNGAPGTESTLQAAVNGFGGFGAFGNAGSGSTSSPAGP